MTIDVRFRGMAVSTELEARARQRIQRELAHHEHEIAVVVVRVTDENGPRGGVDKRCRVTAGGKRIGSVVVEEDHEDAWVAVDAAIARLERALARSIARRPRWDARVLRRAS